MTFVLATFIFFFGASIGSFLNAVVWRLRTGESFVLSRSYCPKCRCTLSALDLVPVFSWLFLRGRCRRCRAGISAQYLLAELSVGALFLAAAAAAAPCGFAWTSDTLAVLLFQWLVIAGMTVVFIYDLRYMLILRSVTWPLVAVGLVGNLMLGVSWSSLLLGAAVGFGFFWLQMVLSKGRWIGGGDLHMGLVMGLILGWPKVGLALWLAYVVGALMAGVLLLRGRHGWKSQIPFGTFLAAATVFTVIYGDRIINWYLGLI